MTNDAMIDLAWAELDAHLSSLDEGALDLCRFASRREDAAAAFQIFRTVRAARKASAAARTLAASTLSEARSILDRLERNIGDDNTD